MADKQHDETYLAHYGTPRHSGRYPWGSGKKYQRSRNFMSQYNEYKKQGLTEKQITEQMGYKSTSDLRARRAYAREEKLLADQAFAQKLHDKGMSNTAIAERMHNTEGTVRNLLKANANQERKQASIVNVAKILGDQIREKGYLDVGKANERYLGITATKFGDALKVLEDQGFKLIYPKVAQLGTNHDTRIKTMIPPGKDTQEAYTEIRKAPDVIAPLDQIHFKENGHGKAEIIYDPISIDKKRIKIRYAEEGGKDKDGVIELRDGVPDLDLGDSHYAQVRILTNDGKSFLKGMAIRGYNMPDGVDIIFNTNKHQGTAFEDVLKKAESDKHNPFKATIDRQNPYTDENGKEHKGALNIVREEEAWEKWSRTLPSQFLSKQPLELAKRQLDISADQKENMYEKIMSLENPTLRKKLLYDFADECDSAAVALKAAAMPRQATKVILPVPSLSDKEVFAPGYENGEEVVLVRFPHQGRFEIPRLKVNNNNREANKTITKQAIDAIGINPKVAEQLSGADFDGDTVLIIPTKGQNIIAEKAIEGLRDFDPKERYARPKGTTSPWKKGSSQEHIQMGMISNLITDMTLHDAPLSEIVRATKHALTIIDVGKHNLDYKASEEENGIQALREKWQGNKRGGASTLISRAKGQYHMPLIDENRVIIDKETGQKSYAPETKKDKLYYYNKRTGKMETRDTVSTKMGEAKTREEVFALSSGHPMETVYANYAIRMKELGNKARKVYANTEDLPYNPAAAKTYAPQVAHIQEQLDLYEKNRPLERLAQRIANTKMNAKYQANPDMDKDEKKKFKNQYLKEARNLTGAARYQIEISDKEWEAINAGAFTKSVLRNLFTATDNDKIVAKALPKNEGKLTASTIARARRMLNGDYTWDEIADALSIPKSTLIDNVGKYVRKGD